MKSFNIDIFKVKIWLHIVGQYSDLKICDRSRNVDIVEHDNGDMVGDHDHGVSGEEQRAGHQLLSLWDLRPELWWARV